jgi:hypothetical protein
MAASLHGRHACFAVPLARRASKRRNSFRLLPMLANDGGAWDWPEDSRYIMVCRSFLLVRVHLLLEAFLLTEVVTESFSAETRFCALFLCFLAVSLLGLAFFLIPMVSVGINGDSNIADEEMKRRIASFQGVQ